MIEVQLPDGSVAEFPDGTSPEVIKQALQKRFGAPQDNRPWYAKAGQAADDVVRLIANGATFGYADKLAGYMGGGGTESERALTQAARDRAGSAAIPAELLGAVGTGMGAAKSGLTLMGRGAPAAMTGAKGLAARSGVAAVEGAGYGALTAMGNDQDIGQGAALGALGGGLGNVAGEGIAAGVGKLGEMFNKPPKGMSADELKAAGTAAYDLADQAGVIIKPKTVQNVALQVKSDLANFGYHPQLQPRIAAVLNELDRVGQGNVTFKGMDVLRRIASNAGASADPSERKLATMIIGRIDDAMNNLSPADVVAGDPKLASTAIKEARDFWRRGSKVDQIETAIGRAERQAGSTGSGGNVDNASRQKLNRILDKPRGYTKDEQEALRKAVMGTKGQNALRLAGKLSPSGNGLMAALGIGGTMVNPAVGALSLGGMAAKATADRMTTQNVDELLRLIATGGTMPPPNALQRIGMQQRGLLGAAGTYGGANLAVQPR